jgi:parallel beta-helix repeat protein
LIKIILREIKRGKEMLKNKIIFVLVIVITSLLLYGQGTQPQELQYSSGNSTMKKSIYKINGVRAYIERGPIIINSDLELNSSGFSGNGTFDDPIRIENYNITSSSGNLISISGTTYYFTITDCLLNGLTTNDRGISFSNVVNAKIEYNDIMNTGGDGIVLQDDSNNNIIRNNTIFNVGWNGIFTDTAYSNIIANNTISFADASGIELVSSSDLNIVSNNTAFNVTWAGINIDDHSSQNLVSNNEFYNNDNGITVWNSSQTTLTSNTIYNSEWQGIWCRFTNFTKISLNKVWNSKSSGIMLRDDNDAEVTQNICHENGFKARDGQPMYDDEYTTGGITVVGNRIHVYNNTVTNNHHNGILVWKGTDVNVSYNTIKRNGRNGITFKASNTTVSDNNEVAESTKVGIFVGTKTNNSIIHNNTIYDNNDYGIIIESECSDNIVRRNNFIYNDKHSGSSQAKDDSGIDFDGNFWVEWTSPDANDDGIVDEEYVLEGAAQNFDHTPLTQPQNLIGAHFISKVSLIYPSGGETLVGEIVIQWTTPFDSSGHTFTFKLSYSNDEGATWALIVSELNVTSYSWNTTTLPNGLSYLIKVEATCSEGESSEAISEGTFEIRNEVTITTTTTSVTTTSSDGTPGISGVLGVIVLFGLVFIRKGRRKYS